MDKKEKQIIHAVSQSDFKKYGCVECNCDFAHNSGGVSGGGCAMLKCGECGTEFVIMADGVERSSSMGFYAYGDKKFAYAVLKEDYAYPIKEPHPKPNQKHPFVRPDIRPPVGEYFTPRGVGYDLAGFVESKEAGARIVAMFNQLVPPNANKEKYCFVTGGKPAWLDYRKDEPLWIQVKIGYSKEKETNIKALCILTEQTNTITPEMIVMAKDDVLAKQIVAKHEKVAKQTAQQTKA